MRLVFFSSGGALIGSCVQTSWLVDSSLSRIIESISSKFTVAASWTFCEVWLLFLGPVMATRWSQSVGLFVLFPKISVHLCWSIIPIPTIGPRDILAH